MAFFDRTATHMLSLIAGVYGVFVYTISFSLEMWFIITSPVAPSSSSPSGPVPSSLQSSLFPSEQSAISRTDHRSYSRKLMQHHANSDIVDTSGVHETESVPMYAFILAAVYFAMVMVSLLLMLGIIIRSMLCVSTWLIAVILLFFPEAALVFFITIYSWGIDSRNGQIELCFYIIRVILNIFFVICVQNLLSQWKSDKQASALAFNLNTYHTEPPVTRNSPYIDSCTTTVNPVFKFAPMSGSQFDARTLTSNYEEESDELDYMQEYEKEIIQQNGHEGDGVRRQRNGSSAAYDSGEKYSTQSLDRRRMRQQFKSSLCAEPRDEIILKPMSHRPFDYLHRPGSTGELNKPDHEPSYDSRLSHSQSFSRKPVAFSSRTLPRHFERISSIQSLRDVAL